MNRLRLPLLLVLVFASINAIANDITPVHGCTEPYYDIDYHDEASLERLAIALAAYSDCLKEFMERQSEQVMVHQKAVTKALDDLTNIQTKLREKAPREVLEEAGFKFED